MKRKILYFTFTSMIILSAGYFFASLLDKQVSTDQIQQSTPPEAGSAVKSEKPTVRETELKTTVPFPPMSEKVQQEVPFVVQAPLGNWSDPNFQYACEEASILMAMGWLKGEKALSPNEAQRRILDIINFENKTFGYSADTDTSDVQKIFKQYFKYDNIAVTKNISVDDIKIELKAGNLVIVPVFGQALQNPNFTRPGPIAHMLVILGYDPATKEFITHDPGTRNGANYHYGENLLFSAIWDYPSGKKNPPLPTDGKMPKNMLSVSRQ